MCVLFCAARTMPTARYLCHTLLPFIRMQIQILRRRDGRPWVLGGGAFGQGEPTPLGAASVHLGLTFASSQNRIAQPWEEQASAGALFWQGPAGAHSKTTIIPPPLLPTSKPHLQSTKRCTTACRWWRPRC